MGFTIDIKNKYKNNSPTAWWGFLFSLYLCRNKNEDMDIKEKFDAESMAEWIHDERFPEDVDGMFDKLTKILSDNINFDRVNGVLPKLAYANGKKFNVRVGELKKMM